MPIWEKDEDFGWFLCGKMAGPFQDVAFATPAGATSAPYESTQGIPYYLEQEDEELIEAGITLMRG